LRRRGLEALLVGGDDGDQRDVLGEGDVLEAVDDEGDLLGLVLGLRDLRDLLEVVDEDDEPSLAGQLAVLLDELADVVDRARRLGAAEQEQVLPVAGDPVEGRPEARVVRELRDRRCPRPSTSRGSPCGHPGS
jgi:hypothetical protein